MLYAAIFFGVILLSVIVALCYAGAYYKGKYKYAVANRLPINSFLRLLILQPDVALARLLDRIALNPVRWALVQVALGVLFGGFTFSLIESGASIPDGLWWAFVSMTTVGYGDVAPKSDFERFLAVFIIVNGIAATAILTAALAGRIAERRMAPHEVELTPELDDDLEYVRTLAKRHYDALDEQCQRIQKLINHPRVLAALREAHAEGGTS